jgi:hypothetical protein
MYSFWKHRLNVKSAEFEQKFGHLSASYKQRCFYWEAVALIKRLCFAILFQTIPLYGTNNFIPYFIIVLLLFCFITLEHVFMPYKKHASSVKSFLWSCLALVLLLCDALIFKNTTVPEQQKNSFAGFMIALITIAVSVSFLTTVWEARKRMQMQTAEQEVTVSVEVEAVTTVEPKGVTSSSQVGLPQGNSKPGV